jgi:WD40 repeat protein
VLFWPAALKVFSALVKDDPDAAAKLKAYHDKEGIVFVQVIDLENGKVQSTTALDTGKNSFRIESIKLAGSRLIIADSQNRVSVYSLEGKRLATVPGRSFRFSSDRLLVDEGAQSERLSLYDLSTFEKRAEYVFGSPVIVTEFSGDGKRLLITTADQTVYLLDLTVSSMASTSRQSNSKQWMARSEPANHLPRCRVPQCRAVLKDEKHLSFAKIVTVRNLNE